LKTHIIILAAGLGKRMHTNYPKVMQVLGGKTMIERVLLTAQKITNKITVISGFKAEILEAHINQNFSQITYCRQEEQLGTAHAVKMGADEIINDEKVLILYGDVPLIKQDTLEAVTISGGACLLTTTLDNPTGYGRIVEDEAGHVQEIVEEKDANEDQKAIKTIFTGVMMVEGALLLEGLSEINNNNAAKEYYLTDLVGVLHNKGVKINHIKADPSEVQGANSKNELHELEQVYRSMKSQELLDKGITVVDTSRVDLRGSITAGKDCYIDANVILEGNIELGDGVKILSNCYLKDVSIGDNTSIESFSHIVSTSIAGNCSVGPYARLREGTILKEGAKIGNFVETKKTTIGKGSKANHLAYLGDTEVGEGSNIGAGTITCNYDGENKHKTTIGNNSFIGTNSSLVAPLNIGSNAYVGAGSVITKDVEDDALAVARGKQSTKPGWSKKKK